MASSPRGWTYKVREGCMTMRRMGAPPLLLWTAAALAAGGALHADATHGAHPTHSIVLGLVALVVASLRRLGRRAMATVPATLRRSPSNRCCT